MLKVNFYPQVEDEKLKYAVIVAQHQGQWVFCKHRQRSTYECPGGHREDGEDIDACARRELWEETGAIRYTLTPVSVYAVDREGEESFGMLYFAQIQEFGPLPESEIEKIQLFDAPPQDWTYPLIQPHLLAWVKKSLNLS